MSKSRAGISGVLILGLLGLMLLVAGSAFASGPPVVTNGEVTNKTLNTATVNGTVDKNGASSVEYTFEYGKTKSYGKSTPSKKITTSGAVSVSAQLIELEPLATYHARIKATSSLGTTYSEDLTFEMLLTWRVEGQPVSQITELHGLPGVEFKTLRTYPTLTFEGISGGGTAIKVSCVSSTVEEYWIHAYLGVSYPMAFTGCKTFLNGKENALCTPSSMPLVFGLNGVLGTEGSPKFNLGEECSIGSSISLSGGFELGPLPEAVEQSGVTIKEHVPQFSGTVTVSNLIWNTSAWWYGKKFGVS